MILSTLTLLLIGAVVLLFLSAGTNYFSWTAFTPDGRSHAMATIDTIGEVLVTEGLTSCWEPGPTTNGRQDAFVGLCKLRAELV